MTIFMIYLMMQADVIVSAINTGLKFVIPFWLIGMFVVGAYTGLMTVDTSEDSRGDVTKALKSFNKWIIPTIIILFLLKTFFPSTKTLAVVISSGVVYEAITSETGRRISGKAVELLEQKIDESLKDTTLIEDKAK